MNYEQELADFKTAILAKYELHCMAFNDGDAEAVVNHFFTADALWVGQGFPERRGRNELREMFMEVVKTSRVGYSSIQSFVKGDSGWDFCNWSVRPLDEGLPAWTFRTMFCWARNDGEWFCNAVTCFPVPVL